MMMSRKSREVDRFRSDRSQLLLSTSSSSSPAPKDPRSAVVATDGSVTRISPTVMHKPRHSSLLSHQAKNTNVSTSTVSSTTSEASMIQQSLRRTQRLLQQELERVSYVAEAIDEDGKLLNETMQDHQTMNVSKAKKALTALERAQLHEQRVLLGSVVFFWIVVTYILWSRLVIRIPFLERILWVVWSIF